MLTVTIVERTGYVIPYAMLSGIIGSVSNGLYSTFKPDTATSKWVGYQVLNGVGRGFGMQMVRTPIRLPALHILIDPACPRRSSRT